MKYDIYTEGYSISGNTEKARLLISGAEGDSFIEACENELDVFASYNTEKKTYWGCRLFDNLKDAQKAFG